MRQIHILVTGINAKDCNEVDAVAVEFNNCNAYQSTTSISYPKHLTKEEIYVQKLGGNVNDVYYVSFDHVGGRPNERQ